MSNTKTKHTPGPWLVNKSYSQHMPNNVTAKVFHAKGPFFCLMDGTDLETAEANARLIAAAPELLEALTALNTRLTSLNSRGLLPDDKVLNALIRAAFDVTERATRGES